MSSIGGSQKKRKAVARRESVGRSMSPQSNDIDVDMEENKGAAGSHELKIHV